MNLKINPIEIDTGYIDFIEQSNKIILDKICQETLIPPYLLFNNFDMETQALHSEYILQEKIRKIKNH